MKTRSNTKAHKPDANMDRLRTVVRRLEQKQKDKVIQNEDFRGIMTPVEQFLRRHPRVCYGGTAINALLPKRDQFYDFTKELPDYDFYSTRAIEDVKQLARVYHRKGYVEVEAKAGVHHGTYKLFVNFVPVADITQMDPRVFRKVKRHAIERDGILYAPPALLQMGMYLELSRPMGDVSRWEKVYQRLRLLNKAYPIRGTTCTTTTQPSFRTRIGRQTVPTWESQLFEAIRKLKCVFFGTTVIDQIERETKLERPVFRQFELLCKNHESCARRLCEKLSAYGCTYVSFPAQDELLPPRCEIRRNRRTIATVYEPMACHAYVRVKLGQTMIQVATIETMMSLFLAFLFTKCKSSCSHRILCLCEYLMRVRAKHPASGRGVTRVFAEDCYGKQKTLTDMRAEKTAKYRELRGKRERSKEFESWFLKYNPYEVKMEGRFQRKGKGKGKQKVTK